MNSEKLFGYIRGLKDHPIQFEYLDICEGDEYNNEHGGEFRFEISGIKYNVGYAYITEDQDDWAQAECYQVTWCRCEDKHVKADDVYNLIENYKSVVRDNVINDILG